MTELIPGVEAPDFEAEVIGGRFGMDGGTVRLSDLRGSTVVLYFYPKDDTPGCTKQACAMRDRWEHLRRPHTEFFGISVDPIERHRKFIGKHQLPFALISDSDRSIVTAYNVWVEKSLYGKRFMGTERTTFVVRPDGRIKSVFRKVAPGEHADILIDDFADFKP